MERRTGLQTDDEHGSWPKRQVLSTAKTIMATMRSCGVPYRVEPLSWCWQFRKGTYRCSGKGRWSWSERPLQQTIAAIPKRLALTQLPQDSDMLKRSRDVCVFGIVKWDVVYVDNRNNVDCYGQLGRISILHSISYAKYEAVIVWNASHCFVIFSDVKLEFGFSLFTRETWMTCPKGLSYRKAIVTVLVSQPLHPLESSLGVISKSRWQCIFECETRLAKTSCGKQTTSRRPSRLLRPV